MARVREVATSGPYQPTWESLQQYTAPRWYEDAKFGVFIHWGVYSVPAFGNEWYARNMYKQGTKEFEHHVATYGPHTEFGYKDFVEQFRAPQFDPAAWAATFHRAGAQFVVPVAEHHDGFAMYATERSDWNAAVRGPGRDVVGELGEAVRASGMVLGASSHRAEHWWFMNGGTEFDSDVRDPANAAFYGPALRQETAPNEQFLEDWLLRTVELIDRHRPQVLWFDWWIETPAFAPYLKLLAAYYYNSAARWGREVVINYKWQAYPDGAAVYDVERGALQGIHPRVWQNDTSVGRTSWSWVPDQQYKTVGELVAELVDVVAKNGVLLLNVGPKADGTLAPEEVEILHGIGDWLTVNGQAIYGSRPWTIPGEGPTRLAAGSFVDATAREYTGRDVRFTTRTDSAGTHLYAIPLGPVDGGVLRIRSWGTGAGLLGDYDDLTVLGGPGEVSARRTDEALEVDLPAGGSVVRVTLRPQEVQKAHDGLN
ncbi:alpha-L-fucosidase [Kineococcus rhizosphaerae]|uniref:alpha-L-fucosidase n=1 Tax=Kineococcus rhizosphaerae TaxID=559628 RepID=UPI003CCC3231